MLVLGIESSCDETAAAVVEQGWRIRSNLVASSVACHQPFGGVVPELACRAHVEVITQIVEQALARADCRLADIDLMAVTAGPGLVGALLVGVSFAHGLALTQRKPLLGVNHLAGHLYAGVMTACEQAGQSLQPYPAIGLVASGGHTVLVLMRSPLAFERLGETQDDAAGEAFDKVAKLLCLGYPGGPHIERVAAQGDPSRIRWPHPRLSQPWDFSFSGLKTAVYYYVREHNGTALDPQLTADVAASFQAMTVEILVKKTRQACRTLGVPRLIVGGGVTANSLLRQRLDALAQEDGLRVWIPPRALCIDNAAMIAGLGWAQWQGGRRTPIVTADPHYPWMTTLRQEGVADALQ